MLDEKTFLLAAFYHGKLTGEEAKELWRLANEYANKHPSSDHWHDQHGAKRCSVCGQSTQHLDPISPEAKFTQPTKHTEIKCPPDFYEPRPGVFISGDDPTKQPEDDSPYSRRIMRKMRHCTCRNAWSTVQNHCPVHFPTKPSE